MFNVFQEALIHFYSFQIRFCIHTSLTIPRIIIYCQYDFLKQDIKKNVSSSKYIIYFTIILFLNINKVGNQLSTLILMVIYRSVIPL